MHDRGVGDWELEESGGTWSAGTVKSNPVSAVGADVVTQVSGCFVDAGECDGALRGCCGTSLVKSFGSSPASRLMAWSLERADLNQESLQ